MQINAATGSPDPVTESPWLQELTDRSGWPHAIIAACDPLTSMVDAERGPFSGRNADAAVRQGAVAAAVVAFVGLVVGVRTMRHSI